MNSRITISLFLFVALASTSACQFSLSKLVPSPVQRAEAAKTGSPSMVRDREYLIYQGQVREHFVQKDYAWLDQEAYNNRTKKLRLPGAYWKLRVFYGAFEGAMMAQANETDWQWTIAQLTDWTKVRPQSVTAKVALATAWQDYAWKARGNGFASSVTNDGWETFNERQRIAANILAEASSLNERCPHWYVTALWIGTAQGWDRDAFEKVFQAGITLEPTYYYIYTAKAAYLMPRWHGEEGEWERFAEASALGPEGEVTYFAIYSLMLEFTGVDLMNDHQQAAPKLIASFHTIERLYGPSISRTNEAALYASFTNDPATTVELFNRIGNDADPGVWRSKQTFEAFRQAAQQRMQAAGATTKN